MRYALVVLLLSVTVAVVAVQVVSPTAPPTPPAQVAEERASVMDLTDEELVEAIGTFAEGASPPPGVDEYDWCRQLESEAWEREALEIPREVVERLLSTTDEDRRRLGAEIAGRSEPPMPETVRRLALDDPDEEVRQRGVANVGWLYEDHPEFLEVLREAMGDPSDIVRMQAAGSAGWRAEADPRLVPLILLSTRDPCLDVRQRGIWHIDKAGKAGVDRAVEMLGGEERDPDLVTELVDCVARAGRLREVIERDPPVVVVTAVIDALAHPTSLVVDGPQCLAGRWEKLLPKYQPEEDWEYVYFFGLAVEAGEDGFAERAILSGEHLWAVRLAALDTAMSYDASRATGVRSARVLLSGETVPGTVPPRIRVKILEHLATARREGSEAATTLLRSVAESDPSEWVRDRARCILESR